MTTLRLNRFHFLTPIFMWWGLFMVLSVFNYNLIQLQNIVGFVFLAIVPGLLTMMNFKVRGLPFWGYLMLTIALSLLELMLMGLLGNTLLPLAGIAQPLAKIPVLIEIYLMTGILMAITWLRVKEIEITIKRYVFFETMKDTLISFIPVIFVGMSALGAMSLNNGGGNLWTLVMLGEIAVYLIFLLFYVNDIDENTALTALFFIGLSLLLMTNLRGWYITGHDIQVEYKVFELAKNAGIWNIAAYPDPYNACLSITILPTIFFNLLNFPDPYIYKFFYQIFFALSPGLVYLIGRHWTSRRLSLLGSVYFISFPTFFTDMPFLNRQEIAFLFFGLMMYVIFNENLKLSMRRWLFVFMGMGVIVSHYSTTYTVLLILGLVVVTRPIFVKILRGMGNGMLKNSPLIMPPKTKMDRKGNINLWMVGILFLLSFLWTQTITHTAGNVSLVLQQTLSAVKNGFGGNNRSIDATSLLSFSKPDQNQELQDYITYDVNPLRGSVPPGVFFATSTYSQYPYVALRTQTIPLTTLGIYLNGHGFDISTFMFDFGQLLAKLVEVLVPLGMMYLLLRKKLIPSMDEELFLISLYCLMFIFGCIVLPVLSTQYGIYRAMQQSMFIIAPIIALGSIMTGEAILTLVKPIKKYVSTEVFAVLFAGVFFIYCTGFLPYLFGGSTAVLHLSNTGTYYDNYLITDSEIYGVGWLNTVADASSIAANGVRLVIQANKYDKFVTLTETSISTDIFPGVIQRNAYVFLDPTTVLKDRATVSYNADPVTYQYPTQFLDDNKNLIYTNGAVKIYR